jgi:hypothetical protein
MKLKRSHRKGAGGLELLDATMDSYMHWRRESREVADSYRNWRFAATTDREIAFDRYVAALDREERAACGYRRVLERA